VVPKELLPLWTNPPFNILWKSGSGGNRPGDPHHGREKGSIEDHFDASTELENHLKKKGKEDLLQ